MTIEHGQRNHPNETGRSTPTPVESSERLKQTINPVVARLLAATENTQLLNPNQKLATSQELSTLTGNLTKKKPTDIDYRAVEQLSDESRKTYWQDKPGTFEERKRQWNNNVSNWIEKKTGQNNSNRHEVIAALNSVGLDLNEETTRDTINQQVDKFYNAYLKEKNGVKKFVSDIAKGCQTSEGIWENIESDNPITIVGDPQVDRDGKKYIQTEDGKFVPYDEVVLPVDQEKLQKRLTAVKGILSSFGNTDGIPELIADYATAHGVLSQKKEEKIKKLEPIKPYLTQELSEGPEKTRLQALFNKGKQFINEPEQVFPDVERGADRSKERPFVTSAGTESKGSPYKIRDLGIQNQDACFSNPERGAFGVFDGVGGSPRGDEASQTARNYISEALAQIPDDLSLDETKKKVAEAVHGASQHIWELNRPYVTASIEHNERKLSRPLTQDEINEIRLHTEMATTGVLVKMWAGPSGERKAIIAHVGDSRIYRLRNDTLECLTIDDSQLREMYDEDEMRKLQELFSTTPENELNKKRVLLKATTPERLKVINEAKKWRDEKDMNIRRPFSLGEEREVTLDELSSMDTIMQTLSHESIDPHISIVDVRPGDRLLLSSDGVHDDLDMSLLQMRETLKANQDPQKAAEALVKLSHDQTQLQDDATAVVVNI